MSTICVATRRLRHRRASSLHLRRKLRIPQLAGHVVTAAVTAITTALITTQVNRHLRHHRPVDAHVDAATSTGDTDSSPSASPTSLLGEVAHEIRTPLTVIHGYVEAMIDGLLPTGPEELAQVGQEIRRLRRLTDDLALLSRTEENRLVLSRDDVDLRDLARERAEWLRPQVESLGVELWVRTSVDPVPVLADPDRINQVMTNLVGNAARATPPGGRIDITVGATVDGDSAHGWIQVRDTGEGLRVEDQRRIFERFYRVEGRRRRDTESGSGIGLTIARGIMRGHGGDLTVASDGPGHGATFTATLPLAGRESTVMGRR
ncbi:cell wall metabolism sensor histidine kinase WalK [Austwickia sp. TVS 96-490-7B]|uniref:sensor histidine kinase n=1 Tax=Austwickia sp. TVS 96-490-7B TaxID=2830843 RepID=UPI001C5697DA|nr:HAMP domain-containing sensor histidine kinase [Austwickia sp. TVS 96-490-7B]